VQLQGQRACGGHPRRRDRRLRPIADIGGRRARQGRRKQEGDSQAAHDKSV